MTGFLINPYRFGVVVPPDDPFDSMYEAFNPETTVNHQRFVEWFSGNVIDSLWSFRNVTGSGSGAMSDVVNGGFKLSTGSNSGDHSFYGFNGIDHYDESGFVCIFIWRRDTASTNASIGMNDWDTDNTPSAQFENDTDDTNFEVFTKKTGSSSSTASSIAVTEDVYFCGKLEGDGTTIFGTLNGVLEVSKTSDYPDAKIEPTFQCKSRSAGVKSMSISYFEVYNT